MTKNARKPGRLPGSGVVNGQCLCCPRLAKLRGLCLRDYNAARRLVMQKKVTWATLIRFNLALPSRQGQASHPVPLLARLEELKAAQAAQTAAAAASDSSTGTTAGIATGSTTGTSTGNSAGNATANATGSCNELIMIRLSDVQASLK